MVNCKPIRDMSKSNKGNRQPRNENQKRAATLYMILHNPMFNEESRRKSAEARKGKRPKKPFPKDNQYWKLRKDLKSKLNNSSKIPTSATSDTSSNDFVDQKQQIKNASSIRRKAVTCRPVRYSAYLDYQT